MYALISQVDLLDWYAGGWGRGTGDGFQGANKSGSIPRAICSGAPRRSEFPFVSKAVFVLLISTMNYLVYSQTVLVCRWDPVFGGFNWAVGVWLIPAVLR